MQRMLLAELAILIKFKSIRIILFVLVCPIVAALALCAGQRNIITHLYALLTP